MKLKDYLDKYNISPVEFAVRCKVSPTTIYHYISERRTPRKKVAERITLESDGLVTIQELRGKDGPIRSQ